MNACVYFGYFEESAALARVAASFLLKKRKVNVFIHFVNKRLGQHLQRIVMYNTYR